MYPDFTTPVNNPGWICDLIARKCTYFVGLLEANSAIKTLLFNLKVADRLPTELIQLCNTSIISNELSTVPNACKFTKSYQRCLPVSTGVPDTGVIKEGMIARLIYRLTYYNNGTADASGVVITENIPGGTTFDPLLSDPRWVCVGDVCTIHLDTLKMGAIETVLFVVNTARDFQAPPTCWENRATISHVSNDPDESPLDNVATFSVGDCCGHPPVICPNPCAECPRCNCTFPECSCPEPICSCPLSATCTCPEPHCICRDPICNCPTVHPTTCPKLNCNCPGKCPKVVEECGCKEIININLPCGMGMPYPCPPREDSCESESYSESEQSSSEIEESSEEPAPVPMR
jgi:hypothetical protein